VDRAATEVGELGAEALEGFGLEFEIETLVAAPVVSECSAEEGWGRGIAGGEATLALVTACVEVCVASAF
jgi:hypothetical protein